MKYKSQGWQYGSSSTSGSNILAVHYAPSKHWANTLTDILSEACSKPKAVKRPPGPPPAQQPCGLHDSYHRHQSGLAILSGRGEQAHL